MTSSYSKLKRNRKPRVHIEYEVETEDGVEKKELPFVIGVLGDFGGDSDIQEIPLKDRDFININQDNFNAVMKKIHPTLNLTVDNHLSDQDELIAVNLLFEDMDDFTPDGIIKQVPSLQALYQLRMRLRDLVNRVDCSGTLARLLERTLKEPVQLENLCEQLNETFEQH